VAFLAMTACTISPEPVPAASNTRVAPRIAGDFWQIAGKPDLGAIDNPAEQPVDFAIWRAKDGTWQLWSCIRGTKIGGQSRLFYRWEGKQLTDTNWEPKGIAMEADTTVGETAGGLQAPYVILVGDVFHMFYGTWEHIAHATSVDGKTFERVIQADGTSSMFGEGTGANTRDPMLLPVGDEYHLYYTANPGGIGQDFVRTSKDLATWSSGSVVARGGQAGTGPSSAECPFVVSNRGDYFLFRTQHYGSNAQTSVNRSPDPADFGVDDDRDLLGSLALAAPEIVQADGAWYIAALLPSLQGIQIAPLTWLDSP
jgi:hypothetical protein